MPHYTQQLLQQTNTDDEDISLLPANKSSPKSFFFIGFTPYKAKQPLQGMELHEKKHKKIKAYWKSVQKEPAVKICLLILDLHPLRSQVTGKHFIGREFQCSCARKETQTSLQHLGNGDRKIMQSIRVTSRPPSRKQKRNLQWTLNHLAKLAK